jgi:hypothetical protein
MRLESLFLKLKNSQLLLMPPCIQCGLFSRLELSEEFHPVSHPWTVYVTAIHVQTM